MAFRAYLTSTTNYTEATEIKVGSSVRVIPHTTYQHLSHGAVIDPMIEHEHDGYETTVTRIFREDMEDENGNPVVELIYEVATGELFNRSQLQVI